MRKILILGANSAIAQAVARQYAQAGQALFLVGRDANKLGAISQDLKVRSTAPVHTLVADLRRSDGHLDIVNQARAALGGLDTVLIAYGELGVQSKAQASFSDTQSLLESNLLSPLSFLTVLANQFENAKRGTIAVITSVAGDRGRGSNYIYGTAKGALSIFLSGLRNRLAKSQVRVIDFKLGFVDTPMTREFKKGALWATPDQVARIICRSIDRGADVVYGPWFWRWIMLVIKWIPEPIFKRISL